MTTANTPAPVLPFVHLNGSSLQTLIDDRLAMLDALRTAAATLDRIGPNGRDYYPDPGRLERAQAQHRRRSAELASLLAEFQAETEALASMQALAAMQ